MADKKKQILFVGRMDYENKRVNRIIEVWEELYAIYPDWELVLVGDGPHKKTLMDYVRRNNVFNVRFEGFRKEPPIPFYKEASIFLLTSDLEGWGLVVVESMMYGVIPVVYGGYESIYDIIRDGVSGFITPKPYNKDITIDRLRRLIEDSQLREQMSEAAIADSHRFDIDSISQQWYSMFEKTIEN